ncbi:vacuolar proton translocating ATPase subunit A, putative [Plasmodium knowlesi strain H]|uniref:V-type proton ATPase subunit a n=3 Tax=Plasmodium knowlesi TaxID=5850 RepID=A0A5E7WU52_PLAKH|nr:V-type proton ATPase subunit a, putative [Plasmodium knowlesi strain H]OTN68703.1 V-type proton ATPase subunit a [Plasmodium knowlesi]CAA9986201.1 V-type proton ATPase subunit a, putative [Plasmodium knowlesi strain H]SBO25405.1 vacuolar proton translocating ATPase subunit A, putative [Plasmodium knowlesi strain H]SBO27694.1 vacuolar proton translocating ATPase subunit A, putative [Plasmodium knowlesi strain H]VVS75675.1 V-type proton ATPase subunit a, putative [Plasmodium knowlesi strain H
MGIFRSETMKHGTLVLPSDRAREYLDCLGKNVDIQFIDMNEKTMKRQYKKYIQRIDDMERILRFLEENIRKLPNVKIKKSKIDSFLEHDNVYELDQVEESLNRLHVQFVRFCNNNKELVDERNNAIEEKHVILTAMNQLNPGATKNGNVSKRLPESTLPYDEVNDESISLQTNMMKDGISMMMFTNISGVIKTKDQESFSRTIFRALRGNTYTYFQSIDESGDSSSGGVMDGVNDMDEGVGGGGATTCMNNGSDDDVTDGGNDMNNEKEKKNEPKSVFVVYCQGSSQSNIYQKILKICKAYDVKTYDWPKTYEQARQRLKELKEIITDKQKALKAYEEYFINEIFVLINVVEPNKNSLIEEWKLFCKKERYIYNSLNCFEGSDITLRCDCWFSANDEEKIRHMLITKSSNDLVSALLLSDKVLTPNISPPTYIKTNKFTKSYQSMVDTYGIPRYGEINPAISTIITFPFLFGIMYGDVGHGVCIFLFALFLILINNRIKNKSKNEMVSMLLDGRYMLLLMGFFAIYAGVLYNDFFSMPLNLFTSMFEVDRQVDSVTYYKRRQVMNEASGQMEDADPYIFGFDAKWLGAENELTYINSFKMKFSIIIGFLHMTFGVLMKGLNALHYRRKMDFFFEFLPQLMMMLSIIGYLVFLIIYKWVTPIGYGGYKKQGIINTVINMYLMKDLTPDNQFYAHQGLVQAFLIAIFVLCIPLMFVCKPAIRTYHIMKEKKSRGSISSRGGSYSHHEEKEMTHTFNHLVGVGNGVNSANPGNGTSSSPSLHKRSPNMTFGGTNNNREDDYLSPRRRNKPTDDEMEAHLLSPTAPEDQEGMVESFGAGSIGEAHHEENISEIWIEQLIETIEFILGLISNTASYLRLWALSLAHQQLSFVFFEQTILNSLRKDSFMSVLINLIVFSQLFSILTIAVILCMDTLECFLHSLRLQWVEFQNKFYKGDGIPFRPFNIKKVLSESD